MQGKTPAQLYATVIGATLVVAGIIGFFYSSAFGAPGETDKVFGILGVNGWHNLVHIASGAVGLAMMGRAATARLYAIGLAVVYTLVLILGLIVGDGGNILGFIPINTEDNVLHGLIALVGYLAYFASADTATRRTAATA